MKKYRKNNFIVSIFKVFLIILSFSIFSIRAYAWTITADFELGTIGQEAEGPSGFTDALSQTFYSSENSHSGSKSAKVIFPEGSDCWPVCGGTIVYPTTLVHGDEIWVREYVYFSPDFDFTSHPVVKILRTARILTIDNKPRGILSILSDDQGRIVLSNEITPYQPTTNVYFSRGKWQSIELYVKLSNSSPVMRIWKDGILVIEDRDHKTMLETTDIVDKEFGTYIFTYWNGGVPKTQYAFIDDVEVTTDKPSNSDCNGNPMIGPFNWDRAKACGFPAPPQNLTVK